MPKLPDRVRLDASAATLVFDLKQGSVALAFAGQRLPPAADLEAVCALAERAARPNQPDHPLPPSVLPNPARGHPGIPPVSLLMVGEAGDPDFRLDSAEVGDGVAQFDFLDARTGLRFTSRWRALQSGVFEIRQTLTSGGEAPTLLACASLSLPLPIWAGRLRHFAGRWAREMRTAEVDLTAGPTLSGSSRGGRSGFGGGQWLLIEEQAAGEHQGRCLGVHLAWSGDHEWRIERDDDGRLQLTVGARLDPGEHRLAAGSVFEAPPALLAFTAEGRSALARLFHRHVLDEVLPARSGPRKVHLNTWEACAFDQSPARLHDLVAAAAALGVERFVLDDGWFGRRSDDRSSLGDWQPRCEVFPHGLAGFAERVRAQGMDLGLWVEPEMVSPDSDLYRQHPDWCLHAQESERPTQRHQLVLDLSREEVTDYLFGRLDSLIREAGLAYLKWDHNRPLFPRCGKAQAQVMALYALLDRLRNAHPGLEIETCASGGGRIDYALLKRCSRAWISDNNDSVERLPSLRGWLQWLPLAVCGHHVGPDPNPITGRRLPMDFRARVAVFGHMGIEADPTTMSATERETLVAHLALYKRWREVLHAGTLHSLCEEGDRYGWLAWQGTRGLALVAQLGYPAAHESPAIRLRCLEPLARYRVRLPEPWPQPAAARLAHPGRWREGWILEGALLMEQGLPLPLTHPHTAWLVELERL